MVYYNGKYWDYFSRANTMYFVSADNPRGPWSNPVKVNNPSSLPYGLGYDNSVFIDDNGKWYLVVKNGQPNNGIVELGDDGQPTGVVYNLSWLNPSPDYPYSWAEGPVMWKYKGYYYYSFARDLSGGQKVMRSDTLTASQDDWQLLGDFFNEYDPLKPGSLFTSPNHASAAVLLDDSTSWVIHPLYAKGEWKGQGRQGLLNQVRYNSNGKPTADYPVNKAFSAPKLPDSGIPWMVPKSDFFDTVQLNPEWSFLGYTPDASYSLTDRPGWLRLTAKNRNKPNTVIKNDGEHNYALVTKVDFNPASSNDQAGLRIIRGDEKSMVKLCSTVDENNQQIISFSYNSTVYQTPNTAGDTVWLRMFRVNHSISGYYSVDGNEWIKVGNSFDISAIDSYSDFSSFTGTRQGLFVSGSTAYFDYYIYRDAYSPILAECPANQYGTVRANKQDGIYQLDDIQNNDWALYAGVEFGNREYLKAPHSIELTASCGGNGGTVEVWLDSINGRQIAECPVTPTGDWNSFKTFSFPVKYVSGRHDVYLRFKGAENERLFALKWIKFTSQVPPEFVSAALTDTNKLELQISGSVLKPSLPAGLSVKVNDTSEIHVNNIDLAPNDSSLLIVSLAKPVLNTEKITVSYVPGTIVTADSLTMYPFRNRYVDNLLPGAPPVIKSIETRNEGDTVWVSLNKKMNNPSDYTNDFSIWINDNEELNVADANLLEGDSAVLILMPEHRIYFEDTVTLSYSGTLLEAANGGALEKFTGRQIVNTTAGYPPQIKEAVIESDGNEYRFIDLVFDRRLKIDQGAMNDFEITLDSVPVTIESVDVAGDTLRLVFTPAIEYGDTINVSYTGESVMSIHNGKLQPFSDYNIENTIEYTAVKDMSLGKNTLYLFPNPAGKNVAISSNFPFYAIKIYDTHGRELLKKTFQKKVSNAELVLDFPPGIYVVQAVNNAGAETVKLIIR